MFNIIRGILYFKEELMENKVMPKVFLWMCLGLFVTFLTGFVVANNENMLISVFSTGGYIAFSIIELILVIVLSARIRKMKETTCKIFFLLYAFVSGLTFSSIFIVYEIESILYIFLIAAILFLLFALIGFKTNIDLTKIGTYLMMALFGVLICALINLFANSTTFDLVISTIVILVFMGITAYDVQKIKNMEDYLPTENLAIYGALQLYLDYINIFLNLLRLFGDDR